MNEIVDGFVYWMSLNGVLLDKLQIHSTLLILLALVKAGCNEFECAFILPIFMNLQTIDDAKSKHVATSLKHVRLPIGLKSSMFGGTTTLFLPQFLYFDSTTYGLFASFV